MSDHTVEDAQLTGINVGDAEELLAKAKNALHRNQTKRTQKLLKEVKTEIQNAVLMFEQAKDVLFQSRDIIKQAIAKGVDITKAKALFIQAKLELTKGNYQEVINLSHMAVKACRPEPLYGKDISVRTAVGYEDGVLKYKINLRNHSEYPLKNFRVRPILPEAQLVSDTPEENIALLKPGQERDISFELGIVESDGSKAVVPGRDIIIQTITSMEPGERDIIHKMKIENMTLEPLYNVSVQPFLPKNQFESNPPEEIIAVMEPNSPKTLKFKLRPIIDRISVQQIKEDFMDVGRTAPPPKRAPPPPPPPPTMDVSPAQKKPLQKKAKSPPPPPAPGGGSKKVIYECPDCKGPFIVETSEPSAVVACPWCGLEVSVGDVKKEMIDGGDKIKPVGGDTPPPPPPGGGDVVEVAPVDDSPPPPPPPEGGGSEFDKMFPEVKEVVGKK